MPNKYKDGICFFFSSKKIMPIELTYKKVRSIVLQSLYKTLKSLNKSIKIIPTQNFSKSFQVPLEEIYLRYIFEMYLCKCFKCIIIILYHMKVVMKFKYLRIKTITLKKKTLPGLFFFGLE